MVFEGLDNDMHFQMLLLRLTPCFLQTWRKVISIASALAQLANSDPLVDYNVCDLTSALRA